MYRMILEAERHALSGRANADALFDNALADIEVKTKSRGAAQFVLLIDEIQLLKALLHKSGSPSVEPVGLVA